MPLPTNRKPLDTILASDINGIATQVNVNTTGLAGKASTTHTHAESDVSSLVADLATKAPSASPTFTGTVTVPTPVNTTDAATKAYVDSGGATVAELKVPSDQTVTNSGVFVDVTGLSQAVGANSEWDFDGVVHYDATATGDAKFQVVVPSGATVVGAWQGIQVAAAGDGTLRLTAITTSSLSVGVGGIGAGTATALRLTFKVIVGVTAGTVKLQTAQNTPEASTLTVHANSYLTAARVA